MSYEITPEQMARDAISEAIVYSAGLLVVATEIGDSNSAQGVAGFGATIIVLGTFARCVDYLKETRVGDAVDNLSARSITRKRERLEDISDSEFSAYRAMQILDDTIAA